MSRQWRILILVAVGLAIVFFAASAWGDPHADMLREAQIAFEREVGGISVDAAYSGEVVRQTENALRRNREKFNSSQFFLLVDRNHREQKVFLAFYDSTEERVTIVGSEKTSTGNPVRRGFFETPTGIFENTPANMSYRALGTKNSKGWRGLGAKGSRVWDLGWQRTTKRNGEPMDIRLLVHSTDPDFGEPRLGHVDSKGCIRTAARFNKFLDYHGVLDRAYEGDTRVKYVLLAKRDPFPFAGKFVVVIDSGEFKPAE